MPALVHPAGAASGRWRALPAVAAAALDLGALVVALLPVGATSCSAYASVASGQAPGPALQVCRAAPTIEAFQSAVPLLALMVALGLVPLLTVKMRRRWPSAASAAVQAVLQFLGVGAFVLWIPAWLLTIVAAAVPPAP